MMRTVNGRAGEIYGQGGKRNTGIPKRRGKIVLLDPNSSKARAVSEKLIKAKRAWEKVSLQKWGERTPR